jgi:hypothetical protein
VSTQPQKRKRRWQFTLRTVLLLVFAASVGLGVWKWYYSPSQVAKRLVRRIGEPSDSFTLSVDNSQVFVETPVIHQIVAIGLPAVPHLLDEMEAPDTSFDSFTRCYSTCDQILRNNGAEEPVLWYGGCRYDSPDDVLRPSGQMDLALFRRQVIADVRRKYKALTHGHAKVQ